MKTIDKLKVYDLEEAVEVMLATAKANFDETIEAHVKLGVDSRHADQQVRGAVVLPHGTGKTVRVLVFAKGDKAKEAQEAGKKRLRLACRSVGPRQGLWLPGRWGRWRDR